MLLKSKLPQAKAPPNASTKIPKQAPVLTSNIVEAQNTYRVIIKKPEFTTNLLTDLIQLLPFNKQERKSVSK